MVYAVFSFTGGAFGGYVVFVFTGDPSSRHLLYAALVLFFGARMAGILEDTEERKRRQEILAQTGRQTQMGGPTGETPGAGEKGLYQRVGEQTGLQDEVG